MTTKRKLLLFAMVTVVAFAVFWYVRLQSLPSQLDRLGAEREIYSILFTTDQRYADTDTIPIAEFTTLGQFDEEISRSSIPLFVDGFPTVKRETFVDLRENNKQSYSLRDFLPVQISKRIMGQQGSYISSSRIGFDTYLTQALVVKEIYFGCNSNGDCPYGSASLFFLQKVNGKWTIIRELKWYLIEDA